MSINAFSIETRRFSTLIMSDDKKDKGRKYRASTKTVSDNPLVGIVRPFCYASTSFQERISIISEFLKATPDYPDRDIAEAFNTTESFVARQRTFLGVAPYVYTPPEPEPEEVTLPEDLAEIEKQEKEEEVAEPANKRGLYRQDIWDKKDEIMRATNAGASQKSIAEYLGCSKSLINVIVRSVKDANRSISKK